MYSTSITEQLRELYIKCYNENNDITGNLLKDAYDLIIEQEKEITELNNYQEEIDYLDRDNKELKETIERIKNLCG
jgi:ferritin